ncbi:MAG: recombination protein RecR [Candidatus Muiribacterium halophilum]|uniref:Recombination protein RecR n=1 Tax=Muiribacterium halophilum TaxID=2053465 RepID=A0A2N5ZD85_MUIH1|nr:MAG: recombination protein RecR [Candidatus Muirbacterium halophilum]
MKEVTPVERLIDQLSTLPSIGRKTAQRLAYFILAQPEERAVSLAESIVNARKKISFCENCFNYSEREFCDICENNNRDRSVVMIVESPKDIPVIESTNEFNGLYHVLHGVISPLKGISPDDLRIRELINRVGKGEIEEVIIGLDFSVESEATTIYISRLLKPLGISITRFASGIPAGAALEYADSMTLSQAIRGRIEI